MAVRTVLKQTEKNSQRDQGEKGWACYYCGKESHPKRVHTHIHVIGTQTKLTHSKENKV